MRKFKSDYGERYNGIKTKEELHLNKILHGEDRGRVEEGGGGRRRDGDQGINEKGHKRL